ncbi:ABC transporter substrate-binding protein, partial [Burkholderia pseudomallei]
MPHTPAQAIQAHAGRERHTMRSTVRPARPTNAHRGKPAAATGAAHRIRCRYAAACRGDVARQRAGGHASAALPAHDDRIAWPLRPAD